MGGFHVRSDLSLAPFVRPQALVYYIMVFCVSRDWLKTIYSLWIHVMYGNQLAGPFSMLK